LVHIKKTKIIIYEFKIYINALHPGQTGALPVGISGPGSAPDPSGKAYSAPRSLPGFEGMVG